LCLTIFDGFSGCLICEKVHQSPSDVLCVPNDSVELTCKHKITNYDTILWYKRSYGDSSLKLIGYARYSNLKDYEESYKDHFSLTGNGQEEVTLKLLTARPDQDSAEYFCAASYTQRHKNPLFHDKNCSLIFNASSYTCVKPRERDLDNITQHNQLWGEEKTYLND